MTTLTQDQHDRAVRFIAANRYPFPDQPHPSWPLHYRTWVNTATHPRRSIETPDGPHFPDIMIVDGENATREIGEVEMDFGPEIGERRSSAQITAHYTPDTLVGRQVMGVVNFPPRQIGPVRSEVLILGAYDDSGVVLIAPDHEVPLGARMM